MFKSEQVLNVQLTQMVEDKNRCVQGCVCMCIKVREEERERKKDKANVTICTFRESG